MKFCVLAALLAAVVSAGLISESVNQSWPWRVGKVYRYDVLSYTLARFSEGASSGNAFKATFIVRVVAPGRLQAKLENPQHALVHQELPDRDQRQLPEDLKYQPVQSFIEPFEMHLDGGRVVSLTMSTSLSLAHENLLKGLISTLQVDLSTHHTVHNAQNNYDRETQQGQFRKMETDVTGDCATLYTVTPASSEWRRELPLNLHEDPMVITKSKNYGHCHHRVAYHFGVPVEAEWTGTADKAKQQQFIDRATNSRIFVGKQGDIYKAEATSTVHVHPYVYGPQKAEVLSHVRLLLTSFEDDRTPQWEQPKESRVIQSLLYSMSTKQMAIDDDSVETQEPEQSDVNEENRVRRSLRVPKKIVAINKIIIKKRNDDNAEDSSSSDSTSAYVNDDIPLNNEPAYAALNMNPQTRKVMKQNPTSAQKLVQETTQILQNFNNMPKADFLSKFNILVRVIAAMDYDQLSQTSRSIEAVKSSPNPAKNDMWMIYRDAVVQAGTLPAFKQIVTWIQSKTIQGEEAAQVVASLVYTLRYPTKETMIQFFKLALSPEVVQQKYLNTTALIAATRFINIGQVNNETAHAFYPTHMYGRLSHQHDNFVLEEILPSLREKLEQVIQQEDSRKAQVYIKAIGLLGHRSILEVFSPYLEGKILTSPYLRALMVYNLDILASEKDSYARAALFSILKNTAEHIEVRLAAIQIIFVSHPTGVMMQAMAQMTHVDPSLQVRSALKTAIETAAREKNPRHMNLSRSAQSALHMLTKEKFGQQYSSRNYSDFFDSEYELDIMRIVSSIGSEDNMLPRFLKYNQRRQTAGWDTISFSSSSVQQFVEKFLQQMYRMRQQPPRSQVNHKYSSDKISQMLNSMRHPQNPLEAAFYINFMNQQRFFSFTEEDLNQLPYILKELIGKLAKGVNIHYTKVFNQAQINVMFPVAMGMPFIYKYKEPTVVHIQMQAQGQAQLGRDYSATIKKEIQFTYARNIDGSVGFLDTLSNQYASAGMINKVQLNIPLKVESQMKDGEFKIRLEHLNSEQDTTIAHYSVWPYTANQKKDSLVPISLDPSTKQVMRKNKVVAMDYKSGQSSGSMYQLQGYSYSEDYRNMGKMLLSPDYLSNIVQAVYQKDVALTHFNFKFLGKQSKNEAVTFTAVWDTLYNLKENTQVPFAASTVQDVTPNSAERRAEIVKKVASGINSAKAQVIDLSAVLEGPLKNEFILTAAIAESPVDPKIQYAFFTTRNTAQGSYQINGVGKVNKPEVSTLNAFEALKKDLKMTFEADVKFGDDVLGNIHIAGQTDRSKKYVEELQKHSLAKQCAEKMSRNNFYSHSCHKMIVMAHAPDSLKATVTYKDVSSAVKYAVFQAWRMAERYGSWYADVNPLKTTPEGKLEIEVQNNYLDNIMSLALNTRYGEVRIANALIPAVTSGVLSTYYPLKPHERFANYYTRHMYQPYCSVDGTEIKTFSNRRYNYTLSSSWHVVMNDAPRPEYPHKDQLVVLARRPSEKQQEIYISYKSETGKDLEIEIQPSNEKPIVKVNTNTKKVSDGELTTYWDDVEEKPFLQYYQQNDGVFMLNIRENRLRIIYDGERLVVLANEGRNNTRGICGLMNGEVRDDYLTPLGFVDSDELFGASYALKDANSDPKTEELKNQAQQKAYQRRFQYTNILRSDSHWQKWQKEDSSEDSWDESSSQKVYRARGYSKTRGECVLTKQVQYYINQAEICITTAPLDSCWSHCKGDMYKVQPEQVVCGSKWDPRFQQYVNQIRLGQNPQVQGEPQIRQYRVPTECKA